MHIDNNDENDMKKDVNISVILPNNTSIYHPQNKSVSMEYLSTSTSPPMSYSSSLSSFSWLDHFETILNNIRDTECDGKVLIKPFQWESIIKYAKMPTEF